VVDHSCSGEMSAMADLVDLELLPLRMAER
jgi:hypothetical protein